MMTHFEPTKSTTIYATHTYGRYKYVVRKSVFVRNSSFQNENLSSKMRFLRSDRIQRDTLKAAQVFTTSFHFENAKKPDEK